MDLPAQNLNWNRLHALQASAGRLMVRRAVVAIFAAFLTLAIASIASAGTDAAPSAGRDLQANAESTSQALPSEKRADSVGAGAASSKSAFPTGNDLRPRPLGRPRADAPKPADSPTSVPAEGDARSMWSNPTLRTAGSLAIVLALIFGLAKLAQRMTRSHSGIAAALGVSRAPEGLLSVLGRYPLARGQTLVLLKLDRRILLLAQTAGRLRGGPGSVSVLSEVIDPEDVASILIRVQEAEENSTADRFSRLLDKFDRTHEGPALIDVQAGNHRVNDDRDGELSDSDDELSSGGAIRLADFERLHAGLRQQSGTDSQSRREPGFARRGGNA